MKTLDDLASIISDKQQQSLTEAGYDLSQVATASIEELVKLEGIGEVTAKKIKFESQALINDDMVRGQQVAEHEIARDQATEPLPGGEYDLSKYSVRVARALQLRGELPEDA